MMERRDKIATAVRDQNTLIDTSVGGRRSMSASDLAWVLLIRVAVFGYLLFLLARTWADPDLWGHVRFGGDILSRGLPATDPYSFTADIPWVNHEWLAEVLMYLGWSAAGGFGLVAVKMALVTSLLLTISHATRSDSISPVTRDLLLFTVVIGIWERTFVLRPQMFSLALFAVLLWIVRSSERGRTAALWLLPLVFALWVNLHGGWIVGLGVLGIWTAIALTRYGTVPASPRVLLCAAALVPAATLLNPYGTGMWTFLADTVHPDRPNISDWRPLHEAGFQVIIPWVVSAGLATYALARRYRAIPLAHLCIVLGLAAASIRVNRLDAFFTLSVVMLLAPQIGFSKRATPVVPRPAWSWPPITAAIVVAVAAAVALFHLRAELACVRLDGPWMPERESGAFIAQLRPTGRLLTWFNWGQYAIWHFAPDLKVSFDGRRETVYSDEFIARHTRLYFEPDQETEFLRRLSADYAWLPANLPLVAALERAGWTRVFSGPASVVLAVQTDRPLDPAAPLSSPCFPGP